MLFGICASVEDSSLVRSAGWDFIEENAQEVLQPAVADDLWHGPDRVRSALLPVTVLSHRAPPELKIAGPDASMPKLHAYVNSLFKRAAMTGIRVMVFGSGKSRELPPGFDRQKAADQIISFLTMTGPIAAKYGVTVALEPVCQEESNTINTLKEALAFVTAVNHANIKCALSTYHFWKEKEPIENLVAAAGMIAHVHLADLDGQAAPGESGSSDYRPIFQILQASGYRGALSVNCRTMPTSELRSGRVLTFLKRQWQAATDYKQPALR